MNCYFENIKIFRDISIDERDKLSTFFKENDYLLLKNVLTDEIMTYLLENITFNNKTSLNDPIQFFREHNDEKM